MAKWNSRSPVLACLLAVLAVSSCKTTIDGYGVHLALRSEYLKNGLRIIMIEDHKVPIISYQTWFRVGSVDEKRGQTGISHLCEHLSFNSRRFGHDAFFALLEDKGADVNAFTSRDHTVFYQTFTPNLLDRVIELESDRMAGIRVDEKIFSTERMVVLEEMRQDENSPAEKIQQALWAVAYDRHPYRYPVAGLPPDVMSLTLEQIQDWIKQYYQPANATIVVVGDFSPDQLLAKIRNAYEAIPRFPVPPRAVDIEPEQQEEHRLTLHDRVNGERFVQAYHVTAAADEDSYAIDVLSNILFEGTSSRAWRRLVEKDDVASSVGATAYTPLYPGLFMVSVAMKNGVSSDRAERALDALIQEIQANGVTQDEVNKAVKQLTVQLMDLASTPQGLGQFIGLVVTVFDDPMKFSQDLTKYLRVTSADVKRVAEKYLQPNNRSIVFLLPDSKTEGKVNQ